MTMTMINVFPTFPSMADGVHLGTKKDWHEMGALEVLLRVWLYSACLLQPEHCLGGVHPRHPRQQVPMQAHEVPTSCVSSSCLLALSQSADVICQNNGLQLQRSLSKSYAETMVYTPREVVLVH